MLPSLPLSKSDRVVCNNLRRSATTLADSIDEYVLDVRGEKRDARTILEASSKIRLGGRRLEPFLRGAKPFTFSLSKAARADVVGGAFYTDGFGDDIDAAIKVVVAQRKAFHNYWAQERGNVLYANTITSKLLVLASPVVFENSSFRSFGHFYESLYSIARKLA